MADRSILITGCSTGIGHEAARTLKSRGWRVLATARKAEDLEQLQRGLGLETIPLELSDPASVQSCADAALRMTEGRLTALYNNAAYGVIGAMEDISGDLLRRHLEVNVIGTHELTRYLIPAMRRNGQGRIVNCSSILGLVSGPYRGPYCASKYALEAISDAMRLELAGTGIHVSLIEPGPIQSSFLPSTLATFKSMIDIETSPHREVYRRKLAQMEAGEASRFKLGPEAVVAKLVHAVESPRPKARYMVGVPTYGAAFLKRVLPTALLDRILARM
jgi:NAD(P)-dependent dehydrogenase (short-subunit alcohol dehydrogenase family)